MFLRQYSEVQMQLKEGYDSSKSKLEDDVLGRRNFAEDIYNLAKNTPPEWAVRIGVYGGWGEGKTTVLNFIEQIALQDKHVVIRFNPWGCTDVKVLWEEFISVIYTSLEKYKIDIPFTDSKLKTKLKKSTGYKKSVAIIDAISKLDQRVEAGVGIVRSFLNFNHDEISKLPQKLKGKRIFVLVDDLDRTDIKLIPQLLFALRELLDLAGFTFILAFDPVIVKKAFKSFYFEEDYGLDFLDKIIDFPRWLPKPDRNQLLALAKIEIETQTPFLDYTSFESQFDFFDRNPRKLKQLIRLFIGFGSELERFDKCEINWGVFILVTLFKMQYPIVVDEILSNEKIFTEDLNENFFGLSYKSSIVNTANDARKTPAHIIEISNICKNHKVELNVDDISKLTLEIFNLSKNSSQEALISYIYLSERPATLTWKEFDRIVGVFEKNTSSNVQQLLSGNVKNTGNYGERTLLRELFTKAADAYNYHFQQTIDSDLESDRIAKTSDVKLILSLIESLAFQHGGFIGVNPYLDSNLYYRLHEHFEKWIEFTTTDDYLELRTIEHKILTKICRDCTIDLIELANKLKPWYNTRRFVDSRNKRELNSELSGILINRICEKLHSEWMRPNWIQNISYMENNPVLHFCLLRLDSPLWQGELREKFNNILEKNQVLVKRNVYQFIELLGDIFVFNSGTNSIVTPENSIINNGELLALLWNCGMKEPVNHRMFTRIEQLREDIYKKYSHDLQKPKWWDRVKAIVSSQKGEQEAENTSGEQDEE